MKKQLLLCKRLFLEGVAFAERKDSVSCGMAISLFQDAVEMLVWTLIKEKGLTVNEKSLFTTNLDLIKNNRIDLSNISKILELNKARINFKHYGNLPAVEEAEKFRVYVEDFLSDAFANHFKHNFEEISLVDLISFVDVKERLHIAEKLIAQGKYAEAMSEAAIAKAMLFRRLEEFVPNVNNHLRDIGSDLKKEGMQLRSGGGALVKLGTAFTYLKDYLELLRETSLVALLHLPLKDSVFLRTTGTSAMLMGDGHWVTQSYAGKVYDEKHCQRMVACLVNVSIRLEAIL